MQSPVYHQRTAGISLVEVIIVAALSVMVFGSIFVSFQFALELVALNRAKLSAVSLANDRMEYFRSLPYDDVGTLTGLIRGPVPTNSVRTLNDITFTERVVVQYVDGVGDGVGAADANGILEDYKQVKLEYTWDQNGRTETVALVSDIMPRAIESNVGGGSIRVNVFDQDLAPLPGARVELSNASSTAPIYEDRLSNASGQVLFSAVPADSNYELRVSGVIGGEVYSVDQTYQASSTNQNPIRSPFAVVEDGLTTQTFFIDELSDVSVSTFSDIAEASLLETFATSTAIASSTNTTAVTSGALALASSSGAYLPNGVAYLAPLTPATLDQWEVIRLVATLPAATTLSLQLFTGSAVTGYTLIPDSELPGNSGGFIDTLIDISGLDPVAYPSITIGVTLSSTNSAVTPEVVEVETFWREATTNLGSESFWLRGNAIIGTQDDLSPVYRASTTVTTTVSGELTLPDLPYDTYTFLIDGPYDIASACPAHPLPVRGGEDVALELLYVSGDTDTVRVVVQDTLGRPIPGATTTLSRPGFNVSERTNTCGQAFFGGGLSDTDDYTLEVSAAGYSTDTITSFAISGDGVTTVVLVP